LRWKVASGQPPAAELVAEVERLSGEFNFFHWHLAFPEVFARGGFDCVLGNPPWVRQELLKPFKNLLAVYSSFSSTADLSVFFLELSVRLLSLNGRCALLTPNKWFRAAYGERLRVHLREQGKLYLVIDFGHSKTLFEDADTFPACVVLGRVSIMVDDNTPLRFVRADDLDRHSHSLQELIAARAIVVLHGGLGKSGWIFNEGRVEQFLNAMRIRGIGLEESIGSPPLYGLKTGLNEAFYLDDDRARSIISEEPTSRTLVMPFIRGRDVKRWVVAWDRQWHIVIPSSQNRQWPWANALNESEAEQIFAAAHPAIHAHLKKFEPALRRRTDQGRYWWELRSCDYYERFHEPKIVISRIAFHSACGLDTAGYFQNDSTVMIPSDDLFILAVLNSRVAWWYMTLTFPHKKDEALSMDADYLERFPLPRATEELKQEIRVKCRSLIADVASRPSNRGLEWLSVEQEVSSLVWKAYGFSTADEAVLDEAPVLRDPLRVLGSGLASNVDTAMMPMEITAVATASQ
jgi:hypothetical protein